VASYVDARVGTAASAVPRPATPGNLARMLKAKIVELRSTGQPRRLSLRKRELYDGRERPSVPSN
jgi:hypothetical protein